MITYPGDDDVRIEVFFKDFSNAKGPKELADGRGPVISLLVRDFEVMRFDCLGPTGHCHIVFSRSEASSENRLWLHERSVQAQVERAVFEIAANCNYYLQRNPEEQVREVRLEEAKLRSMCRDAYQVAMSLAAGL